MSYFSLSHFLTKLEEAGELRRIKQPVATELQITELADREMKSPGGGKRCSLNSRQLMEEFQHFPWLLIQWVRGVGWPWLWDGIPLMI